MSRVGFEPTITAFERAETVHALAHAATVTGHQYFKPMESRFLGLRVRVGASVEVRRIPVNISKQAVPESRQRLVL
jgi:hypothetical protein